MENPSIYAVFERMWQHILAKFNSYISTDVFEAHTSNTENPHGVTKAQLGLGNVNNTSDLDKPISTATQTALDDIQESLDKKADIDHIHWSDEIEWNMGNTIPIYSGGTGESTFEDYKYTAARYRASALLSKDKVEVPGINGVIHWVYE